MTKHNKTQSRWKSALTIFLALLMCCVLAFFAACNNAPVDDDDDDDTSTSTTQTDEQLLKNGNFEFGTSGGSVTFPVYTGINWTKSKESLSGEDADTSDITSGIIDTSADAFNAIEESKRPHTNPGVHAGAKDGETKILMIANKSAKKDVNYATAQKFTSTTTLSLTQDTYAKVSFWVLTQGLEKEEGGADKGLTDRDGNPGNPAEDSKFGANVALINTVGSVSQVAVKLTNINTYGAWKQYSIYVKASDYTTSSIQLAVGLGQASATVVEDAVAGRAFFDDFTYEVISAEDYAAGVATVADVDKDDPDNVGQFVIADGIAYNRAPAAFSEEFIEFDLGSTCRTDDTNATKLAAAFEFNRTGTNMPLIPTATPDSEVGFLTKDASGIVAPKYAENDGLQGVDTVANIKANAYFANAFGEGNPLTDTQSGVYIGIKKASSYTVSLNNSFLVEPSEDNGYVMLSFWAKTSDIANGTKAPVSVQLIDKGPTGTSANHYLYHTSFTGINTTPAENEEDVTFDGWKKYTFFVANNYTTGTRNFSLSFSFGPTDLQKIEDPMLDYALPGWAIFAGFETSILTEEEYNAASTNNYAKKTALYAGYEVDSNETGFDSMQASMGDKYKVEPVAPQNYVGVPANHLVVNGTGDVNYNAEGVVAGLVHADYAASYGIVDAPFTDNASFFNGTTKKPLMISTSAGKSYGFIGAKATIAEYSYATVSVRVRTSNGATASVYMVDLAKERTKRDSEVEDNTNYLAPLKIYKPTSREDLYSGDTKDYSFTNITSDGDWTTYTFYIATGELAKTYRLELWNGTRDNATTTNGYVFFDLNGSAIQASSSETEFNAAKDTLTLENVIDDFIPYKISEDDTAEYKETFIYGEAKEGASVINSKFFELSAGEILDLQEEDEQDTTPDTGSGSLADLPKDQSVWLLISSLIIAVVLILTIILILIRKYVDNKKKKYTKVRVGYDKTSRDKVKRTSEFNVKKGFEGELETNEAKEETIEIDYDQVVVFDEPEVEAVEASAEEENNTEEN